MEPAALICLNPEASIQLPARNLLIASDYDRPLLTPCAACFHRLKICQAHLKEHPEDHPNSSAITGVDVLHINEMLLKEEILRRIQASIKEPLVGLKTVPYYGCLTVRPPRAMKHPHPEDPREMDAILKIIGAEACQLELQDRLLWREPGHDPTGRCPEAFR